MKFLERNKGAILFYLVLIVGTLAICYNNKIADEKEKSISTNWDYVDIQK